MATKRRANKKRRGTRRRGGYSFHLKRKFASLTGKNYVSHTILTKRRIEKIHEAILQEYANIKFNKGNSTGLDIINNLSSLTYEVLKKSSTYQGIRKDFLEKMMDYISKKLESMKEDETVKMHEFISELIIKANESAPNRSYFLNNEPKVNAEYNKARDELQALAATGNLDRQ